MKHIIASLISASCICTLSSSYAADKNNSSTSETYMNSEAFTKSLTDGVLALQQSKQAPAMAELLLGLATKQCTVELQEPSKYDLNPVKMYERFKRSVVMLGSIYKCKKCSNWHTSTASGFFLTKSGILVTNYHVVNHPDHAAMGAITSDGKIYAVKKILAADKDSDVAIIKIDGTDFEPMALIGQKTTGSPVFVIGHPSRRPYTLSSGIISGYFLVKKPENKEMIKRMTVTADYGVGSSGGPVMDECGNVTGIVASTQPVMGGCDHNQYAQMIFRDCVPSESILALIQK